MSIKTLQKCINQYISIIKLNKNNPSNEMYRKITKLPIYLSYQVTGFGIILYYTFTQSIRFVFVKTNKK